MQNTIVKILFLVLFSGCTLSSRETFELAYQDQFIMATLDRDLLKSINEEGIFNQDMHDIWDFNAETMEVGISSKNFNEVSPVDLYAVEIIQDINTFEGVLRLYGNGAYNGKYVGVHVLTNDDGIYAKFSIQDLEEQALENAREKPYFEYVSDPIIFRIHRQYENQTLVSLNNEEFFDEKDYEYFIPKINRSSESGLEYFLERYTVQANAAGALITNRNPDNIILLSTTVKPLDLETHRIRIAGQEKYLSIIFKNEIGRNKIKMGIADSHDESIDRAKAQAHYTYELQETADRPNKVIQTINLKPLVLLSRAGNNNSDIGIGYKQGGQYFWEKSEQFTFNSDEMTLEVISTLSTINYISADNPEYEAVGITNRASYKLRMLRDKGDMEGIFVLTGDRLFNNKIVGVRLLKVGIDSAVDPPRNPANPQPKYRADFIFQDPAATVAQSLANMEQALTGLTADPKWKYQDLESALRPYRLAENLNDIGPEWVALTDDDKGGMTYDPKNTEVFEFIRVDGSIASRRLKYTSFVNGGAAVSYYKVIVAFDSTDTNGVFQLIGFSDDKFTAVDDTRPLHNQFIAIERGSEINNTDAKLAKGSTLAEALSALRDVPIYNLAEKVSLPSPYRVINQMAKFNPWVAVKYGVGEPGDPQIDNSAALEPGYSDTDTIEYCFNTSGIPKLKVMEIDVDRIVRPTNQSEYEFLRVEADLPERGIYKLIRRAGSPILNLAQGFLAIQVGEGNDNNKAYFAYGNTSNEAATLLDSYVDKGRYTHYSKEIAPIAATVLTRLTDKKYMAYDTDPPASGSIFPIPNGNRRPYNTKYYSFNYGTLVMSVLTYNGDTVGVPSMEEYNIRMRADGGMYNGIFMVEGSGALDRKFIRLDVQQGNAGAADPEEAEANKIRMLIADSLDDLDTTAPGVGVVADVLAVQHTTLQEYDTVAQTFTKTALTAFYNADPGGSWASVDEDDKKYDYRNNRTVTLANPNNFPYEITIDDYVNGARVSTGTYRLELMENNFTDNNTYSFVAKLTGSGALRDQYIAVAKAPPTTVGNSGITPSLGHRIVVENTFNKAKNGLTAVPGSLVPPNAFVQPTALSANMIDVLNRDYKKGTPSFVRLNDGVYDKDNTEIWLFTINDDTTNVSITYEPSKVTELYNLYMELADPFTADGAGGAGTRARSLFYLRSVPRADNPSAVGRYHKDYVHIQDLTIDDDYNPHRTRFNATINENRTVALAGAVKQEMRDISSVSLNAGAVDVAAAASSWMRVADNSPEAGSHYQLNRLDTEEWIFNFNGTPQIKVITTQGASRTEVLYNYRSVKDESASKGVIQLLTQPGSTPGPYANKYAALALADMTLNPAPNFADRQSMRLFIGDLDRTVEAGRDALVEWNFRTKAIAELSFSLLQAIDPLGIVELTKNADGKYDYVAATTKRIQFKNINGNIENTAGSRVLDILIDNGAVLPGDPEDRYGMKLLESEGYRFAFQIFRKSSAALSNTFMQLEMGQGVNEGLVRIGTGSSLAEAKRQFSLLGSDFNYAYYSRATADWGVLNTIQAQGEWSLQRKNPAAAENKDIITGSATVSDSLGHVVVGNDGSGKPVYNPINTLDVNIIDSSVTKIMRINNYRSEADLDASNRPVFSYGLEQIEEINDKEGIYQATGFGEFENQFIYLELTEDPSGANPNAGKKARFSAASSIAEVKNLNDNIAETKYNFFVSDWIKTTANFITAADTLGPVVTVDTAAVAAVPPVYIFDTRDHAQWEFEFVDNKPILRITATVGGVGSIESFELTPINDLNDRGIFQITGGTVGSSYISRYYSIVTAPAGGSAVGRIFSKQVSFTTDAEKNTAIAELNNFNVAAPTAGFDVKYAKSAIAPNHGIPTKVIATDDVIVTYDQDNIYLPHEAKILQFDQAQNTVDITEPDDRGLQQTSRYFLNDMVGADAPGDSEFTRGFYYLKGTVSGNKYHNHVLALQVRVDTPTTVADKADYGKLIITNIIGAGSMTVDALDNLMESSTIHNTALRESVTFNEDILDILHQRSGMDGITALKLARKDFEWDPENVETLIFDIKNRAILYVLDRMLSSSHGGDPIRATNFVRMKISAVELNNTDPEDMYAGPLVAWKVVSNTRTDINFRNSGLYTVPTGTSKAVAPVYGDELQINALGGNMGNRIRSASFHMVGLTRDVARTTSWYWGLSTTQRAARNDLFASDDPKLIEYRFSQNQPVVLADMAVKLDGTSVVNKDNFTGADVNWFIPIDEEGAVEETGAAGTVNERNLAVRPVWYAGDSDTPIAGRVYQIAFAKVSENADGDIVLSTKEKYHTRIFETGGERDVVIAHGTNYTGSGSLTSRVSNKFLPIIVGQGKDETLMKLDIRDQADIDNALPVFWNYATKKTLESNPDIITSLANSSRSWVYISGPNIADPEYVPSNTTNWDFRPPAAGSTERPTVSVAITNGDNIQTHSYIIHMRENPTASSGIFLLTGVGIYADKFVYVDYNPRDGEGSKIAIASTIAGVKTAMASITRANFYRQVNITSLNPIVRVLLDRTKRIEASGDTPAREETVIVETTYHDALDVGNRGTADYYPYYYNPKSVYEYRIITNSVGTVQIVITHKTKTSESTEIYELVPESEVSGIVDPSGGIGMKGYFRLSGLSTQPEHNKIMGFYGVKNTRNTQMKIQVEGRSGEKLGVAGTIGDEAAQERAWNNVRSLNVEKSLVFRDREIFERLSGLNQIGSFVSIADQVPLGVYDERNTTIYAFSEENNDAAITTIIDGVSTFYSLDASIVYPELLLLEDKNTTPSTRSPFHNKFIAGEFVDDQKVILARASDSDTAYSTLNTLRNRRSTYPYSYWTQESLGRIAVNSTVLKNIQTISKTVKNRSIIRDWTIDGTLESDPFDGWVWTADSRFFKNNNGTGNTRVQGEGGYFDDRDYYYLKFENSGTVNDLKITRYITNAASVTTAGTTTHFKTKVLKSDGVSRIVLQIIKGANESAAVDTELKTLFENRILAIDMPDGPNNTGMIVGTAVPESSSEANMQAAVTAAEADLNSRLTTGFKQYTPNIIPQYNAQLQQRAFFIINKGATRTFVNENGIEARTTASSPMYVSTDVHQLVLKVKNGDSSYGNTNQFSIEFALKSVNNLNGGSSVEDVVTSKTRFLVRPLETEGKDTILFRLHRPIGADSAISGVSFFSNITLNQVHAMQTGSGANLLLNKWTYAGTSIEALNKLRTVPFYNQSYIWISTSTRRARMSVLNLSGEQYWKVKNNTSKAPQNLESVSYPGTVFKEMKMITFNSRYYMRVQDYSAADTPLGPMTVYEILPKDLPTAREAVSIALSGIGPMDGYFWLYDKKSSSQIKVIWAKPRSTAHHQSIINQFHDNPSATGDFEGDTMIANLKVFAGGTEGDAPNW